MLHQQRLPQSSAILQWSGIAQHSSKPLAIAEAASPVRCTLSGHSQARALSADRRDHIQCSAVTADRLPETSAERLAIADQPASCLLCAPIVASTWEGARADIREASQAGADAVELRLDFLQDLDVEQPAAQLKEAVSHAQSHGLKCILTLRPSWEGGQYKGPEETRLKLLQEAFKLDTYVDVELEAMRGFGEGVPDKKVLKQKLILSKHYYDRTPTDSELRCLLEVMNHCRPAVAKIASTAQDITDALRMLALPQLSGSQRPVIALAMGERGVLSRILASRFGAFLTFGALSKGRESAPGQPLISDLRSRYRLQSQTEATKVFGIIGNPVAHSRSPLIHNSAFQEAGINAVYVPLLVDDLNRFLQSPAARSFSGFSVTIPHKETALRLADSVGDTAQRIGAVNTLIRQPDGSLAAHNTDWTAAIGAIEAGLAGRSLQQGGDEDVPTASSQQQEASPLHGKHMVVLGAGGTARALVFGALSKGCKVTIANRSRHRAEELAAAADPGVAVASLEEVQSGSLQADVLVNTTSVGMHPNVEDSPMPAGGLGSFQLVFDAIYTPVQTRLLQDAQQAGCTVVNGLEMFVGQAVLQYQLFTGQDAPVDIMRRVVTEGLP